MDWLLTTPQIHSAFSSLGSLEGDTYVVSPNALAILEEINCKLTYEDQTLRTFRRAIGFGQNVRTDLIPLLENAKDDDVLDSVIRILVNLTVPIECLFSVDVMYRTEVGRHTIFELNRLLYNSKEAFTDAKSTKSVVEFMKHILESDSKLSPQKCDQINNCLVLLRNILHIPETNSNFIVPQGHTSAGQMVSMQNAILWNLFIQSIDKLLLYLMTCPQRAFWGVTMVQLIALMYKDQHVSTLQKLLNMWFEASLSESSEDNESNTSPPKQGSGDSSPMLTSDPTSDSSDNGGGCKNESSEDRRQALREETEATLQEVSRKGHEYQNAILRVPTKQQQQQQQQHQHEQQQQQQSQKAAAPSQSTSNDSAIETDVTFILPPTPHQSTPTPTKGTNNGNDNPQTCQKIPHSGQIQLTKGKCCPQKRECPSSQSELSDCGYGTQVENQESISTSSNEDDGPENKPAHQKPPCNSKPRNKQRAVITLLDKKELRRKKLVKRGKSTVINMKGLVQHVPTDEDISNLLKEFTVDFLLKGYSFLVEELHGQLLTNMKMPIDTSHFFWLVTYFLKFAAQLELDLEHIHSILSFDVLSYFTYEGVMLCERLELNSRQEGSDLKPYLRRLHLLVTAIREFLQAIETYKKVTHLSEEDREHLHELQVKISATEDLRNLFVLLMRRFNPNLHTKQYLQDLVVTNHMLLLILDTVTKSDTNSNIKMIEHISQFATPEIMHFYGMLLEDFDNNGEFVNNCIFTMMHHISGDLEQISTLFQPVILKTYSRIWEADYELCDDWSDLIEYVINKFMNTPQKSPLTLQTTSLTELTKEHNLEHTNCSWTQEEMDTLYWYYVQSKKSNDVVGKICKLFSNNGNRQKSRISIIQQLLQQDIITLVEYDDLMKFEDAEYQRKLLTTPTSSTQESGIELQDSVAGKPSDDFQILRDLIIKENKGKLLTWLQNVLLDCCYVKLNLQMRKQRKDFDELSYIMEPVAYHSIYKNKSIPVVPWNTDQANIMLYQPFVLLLHKLGFQLPADAGSVYPRIPEFWTAEMMFNLAKKLGPLDKLQVKFDVNYLSQTSTVMEPIKRSSLSVVHEVCSESEISIDTDISADDTAEKSIERDVVGEVFAVPKTKQSNSIIRFTPHPSPTTSVPNWLHLVMRSKCVPSEKCDMDITMPANVIVSSLMTASHITPSVYSMSPVSMDDSEQEQIQQQQQQQQQYIQQQQQNSSATNVFSDDNSAMPSLDGNDRRDSSSSGVYTQRSGSLNLDSEYSAIVASVYESEIANSDTASVISDLTRMNVSDDDEKHEYHHIEVLD